MIEKHILNFDATRWKRILIHEPISIVIDITTFFLLKRPVTVPHSLLHASISLVTPSGLLTTNIRRTKFSQFFRLFYGQPCNFFMFFLPFGYSQRSLMCHSISVRVTASSFQPILHKCLDSVYFSEQFFHFIIHPYLILSCLIIFLRFEYASEKYVFSSFYWDWPRFMRVQNYLFTIT